MNVCFTCKLPKFFSVIFNNMHFTFHKYNTNNMEIPLNSIRGNLSYQIKVVISN